MYQRRRSRWLVTVLVLVSLTLVTLDVRSDGDGVLERGRLAALAVAAPLQSALSAVGRVFGDVMERLGDLVTGGEEEALSAEVSRLRLERQGLLDLERENRELRAALGLRERTPFDGVVGRVTARTPTPLQTTATIDVGAADGVRRDAPVVTGDGLVGRVLEVTAHASVVLLVTDPAFAAAARVGPGGELGTVEGRGGVSLTFDPLDPRAPFAAGDRVVTAFHTGGVFPDGIEVGVVTRAGEPTPLLERTLEIRPAVDVSRLDAVLVVTTGTGP